MHISFPTNSLASAQAASAATTASKSSSAAANLFSVDPTGGQDLQGGDDAATASLPSGSASLIAPSSLLLAQQMGQADDSMGDLLDPGGQGSQSSALGSKGASHRTMLS